MDEAVMVEVRSAMASWRSTHPHATFAEIEEAVEEQIGRIRARMLEQVVADGPVQEHAICRCCGTTMVPRSEAERQLTVQGDEAVHLRRPYAVCPSCGAGLFPPG
jgi:YgiT-type zinc finger domain-containing protein